MLRRTPAAPMIDGDPAQTAGAGGSLRETAIRSGAYLIGREAAGVGIRLLGLVLVMRQIGPADFGIYGAAAAYVLFATTLAQMGAEVFLIRQPGPLPRRRYDEVFTALLVTSSVVVVLGMTLTFVLAPWLRPYGVVVPTRVLLLSIPVNVLWAPMQAYIERQFAYRKMGLLELGGDVVLYGTAVPLAFLGAGPWSLIAGFCAWQTWLLVGSMALSGLWPRLAWSSRTARELLTHGRTYALTTWIYGARSAVLTLIVGTYTGAVGVGLVNFAQRLVSTMNFTDRGVHRIGMVAISRVSKDRPDKLSKALEEGTLLLMVVAALPFAVFGLAAHWVVPDVFGHDWLPALPVYVLLALWATLRVPVTVQRTLLYAYGRNIPPAITSTIEMVIVCAVGLVAVRELGIVGFGIASVVAVSSTAYTHFAAHRLVAVHYRRLALPLAALVPPVFVPLAPMPWSLFLLVPPLAMAAVPAMRAELRQMVSMAWSTVARPRPAAPLSSRGSASPGPRTATAVAGRPVLASAHIAITVAAFASGGPEMAMDAPEMAMNGSSRSKTSPLFPPFQAWRLESGIVVDPTNPRIADRAALDAYGLRTRPLDPPPVIDGLARAELIGAPRDEEGRPPGGGRQASAAAGVDPRGIGGTTDGAHRGHDGGRVTMRDGAAADPVHALLLETDPVTGLPAATVLLARLGRLLGAVRDPGWALAVVAVELRRADTGRAGPAPEQVLAQVAEGLRSELRFDDLVARVGTSAFVAAVAMVGRGANGAQVAAHLEGAARRAFAPSAGGAGVERWTVRSSHAAVPLPCDRDADELVRRVLGALDG